MKQCSSKSSIHTDLHSIHVPPVLHSFLRAASHPISIQTLLPMICVTIQVYQTFCVENHTLTLVAADARPVQPVNLTNGCVDVNTGQR